MSPETVLDVYPVWPTYMLVDAFEKRIHEKRHQFQKAKILRSGERRIRTYKPVRAPVFKTGAIAVLPALRSILACFQWVLVPLQTTRATNFEPTHLKEKPHPVYTMAHPTPFAIPERVLRAFNCTSKIRNCLSEIKRYFLQQNSSST